MTERTAFTCITKDDTIWFQEAPAISHASRLVFGAVWRGSLVLSPLSHDYKCVCACLNEQKTYRTTLLFTASVCGCVCVFKVTYSRQISPFPLGHLSLELFGKWLSYVSGTRNLQINMMTTESTHCMKLWFFLPNLTEWVCIPYYDVYFDEYTMNK